MIWLIGNKGMLGTDVELVLKEAGLDLITSDMDVDITDKTALRNFVNNRDLSWIINCSAYTAVDKAEDETELAFRINADGVKNIAEIAREKNAVFIHISTDYVFDGGKKEAYTEDDIPEPLTAYGKSKLAGEQNLIEATDKYFIIRIAWLYGKHGNNFVHTMLRLFAERDEVKVVSDQFGTPTYTLDVAELIKQIIVKKQKEYGIYHFSGAGKTTWFEFAQKIYELAKKYSLIQKDVRVIPIKTADYPTKAKRPCNSLLYKEKIRKNFSMDAHLWQDSLEAFLKEKSRVF